ncbi:MMPL family transporter [Kitasatospora purpeofusca]|uniref:MMPL family transporter n=1 Tax=Kitasatospora purpeofusca TaxID=67352 RepID=UPI002253ED59|nr:MMPL family transporter [Kitasatospora purpeofusca]MCX4755814.1 MMPL family transporter [Kitasatospora purpeofusca]WSR36330.1 MMPL family transporter [Kitasatospora purpeofusca]WSR44618.1 MMPL family transporter [Kitasatospora purpeofusca]
MPADRPHATPPPAPVPSAPATPAGTPTGPSARRRRARLLVPLALLIVWLGLGGAFGSYAGRLGEVATNDRAAFLPRSAESTEAARLGADFRTDNALPVIIVWESRGGPLDGTGRAAAEQALRSAAALPGATGRVSPALPAADGQALQGVVQLRADLGRQTGDTVSAVRELAEQVPGTTVGLAGPAAIAADLGGAFAGIDGLLLGVALGVVLLILLAVYRAVLLPLLVILGAVFALGIACALVYLLADHGLVTVDGQVQGLLSILVIGAATDYGLLLSARFREELHLHGDRFAAMRTAWRHSVEPIAASGATVALGLLVLLLSDLTNNRALGPVGAIGIACAVLSALTFLPAALVLAGRAAYWPARPAADGRAPVNAVWARVAELVARRPRVLWAGSLVVLAALAALAPTLDAGGVPQSELFVKAQPSAAGQRLLSAHFPGGSGNPAVIIAAADRAAPVTAAAAAVPGVAAVRATTAGAPGAGPGGATGGATGAGPGAAPLVVDGRVRLEATLTDPADSDAAIATVHRLRDAVHAVPDARALVGGYTAQQDDTRTTAAHDRRLITPVVLLCVLAVLVLLLRSLVAPLLLAATVALSYLATLGVSAVVFPHVFGFSAVDPSVPLYGYVFLVALGVDYNIFLMTRVREESLRVGTREGVLRGLTATGGVITSAGVVLAATFAALAVIPLAFLAQIAFIVAFGVLLDTLLVRSLLVPALVRDLGDRVWWPAGVGRGALRSGSGAGSGG